MPSPSPISALTVQPARSTVGAALRPLPGFGVNRDFFFLVVSQYPVSIDSYPIKHRGHAGLSLGLMSPLFDGEPLQRAIRKLLRHCLGIYRTPGVKGGAG